MCILYESRHIYILQCYLKSIILLYLQLISEIDI